MRQRRLPLTDGARAAGAADAADSRGPTGAAHGPGLGAGVVRGSRTACEVSGYAMGIGQWDTGRVNHGWGDPPGGIDDLETGGE
jgi:hypothetical protein